MSHFAHRKRLVGMSNSTLVVGAGYGGILTANRLYARGHRVTVINESPDFVDRIRLHEYAAGSRSAVTRPLSAMLRPGIELVVGRATRVRPGISPVVELADGSSWSADHVVLAVGSGAGSGPVTLAGAGDLRRQLRALPAGARVRIDGAGLTGIETATEIARAYPGLGVHLHDPAGPLPSTSPRNQDWLRRRLPRLGVRFSQEPTDADLVIECTGLRVPSLAADSGLPVDRARRVLLQDDLTVCGQPNIWGVGDAGVVHPRPLRMACAVAEPMGGHVADSINTVAMGRPVRPFDFGYMFQCISLGRRDGMIVVVHRDDRPIHFRLTGWAGARFKELISTSAVLVPARWATLYRWAGR